MVDLRVHQGSEYPPIWVRAFAPFVQIASGAISTAIILGSGLLWGALVLHNTDYADSYFLLSVFAAICYQVVAAYTKCYDVPALSSGSWGVTQVVRSWVAATLIFLVALYLLKASNDISRLWAGLWFVTTGLGLVVFQIQLRRYARQRSVRERLTNSVVVVGGGEHGARFIDLIAAADLRVRVLGYFDDRSDRVPKVLGRVPYLGSVNDLIAYAGGRHIDEIVIALPWSADDRILNILRQIRHLTVNIRLAPEKIAFRLPGAEQGRLSDMPVLDLLKNPLSEWKLVIKAAEDRVLASCLLLAMGLPMLVIAAFIRLDSPGPVLFRQKRIGFNNKPFDVLKFRTMRHDPDRAHDARQAVQNDRRVTRLGRFLRRSSLDELPQIFNVLQGNMSLVGPRPHPAWVSAADLWKEYGDFPLNAVVQEYAARHRVKPGITGWAQVCGYRGETETVEKMRKRVEHDLLYIDRWSLAFDLKILGLTAIAVFRAKNAY